jgi:phosphoribosylformylglycinamidine synthase II
MRVEVYYKKKYADGRAHRLLSSLKKHHQLPIHALAMVDVYILEGIPSINMEALKEIFSDPIAQEVLVDICAGSKDLLPQWSYMAEITFKAGVTDPVALTSRDALKNFLDHRLSGKSVVQTAQKYLFQSEQMTKDEEETLLLSLHNPLIQTGTFIRRNEWEKGKRTPSLYPHTVQQSPVQVESFAIAGMDMTKLMELSKERLLALSLDEMKAIQSFMKRQNVRALRKEKGLPEGITDVELEMIAQTWSEHCKHKIFNAVIEYKEGKKTETITSLFNTYIKKTTEKLSRKKKYLVSVFHDNSGVIRFDKETLLCFKVETHNSPSALDPYGGAITGIVGVNRDIIGTGIGAKPIFNTNLLCFGYPDTPHEDIPEGILHPLQVMAGVHKGIIDGGNQSGIPVVAGGFLFDESYLGKPLVYCGTGGILPAEINGCKSWEKKILAGDLAVMTGGRIGKDGIHGATFSSRELDEASPTSAVQIGDPITQKKMLDFLIEARDRGLYRAITDNGAGGLSSSLGEMAELCGGVKINLHLCPLKYQGLAPWEILVSESQERMSLAVAPEHIKDFLLLAEARDVEATVVGEFTDSGFVEIFFNTGYVGLLELDFLHNGLPRMSISAEWTPKKEEDLPVNREHTMTSDLLELLADPNIASKESLVRQYDHEVQAYSVVKPFVGIHDDGHSDGAVLKPRYDSRRGITITHGICPRYGDIDTYHMAMCAVDEAFRAHIALGGSPDEAAALDNFCWPDPLESDTNPDALYKSAQLVRTCKGLHDACIAYSIPLISGKDSMKNDARLGGKKISVRPTLLISLMGIIPDIRYAQTTDFKAPGHIIFILGNTNGEMGGTRYERITGARYGRCPQVEPETALKLYRAVFLANKRGCIESCHDISDGGLAVAVCESAYGGRLGADINLDDIPGHDTKTRENARLLFCETPSRFIVTVSKEKVKDFSTLMQHCPHSQIGEVKAEPTITIHRKGKTIMTLSHAALEKAWKNPIA